MYNDLLSETGGAFITPSARRSIHNHANCPFMGKNRMGVYGLGKKRSSTGAEGKQVTDNSHGVDVVDNVMSKCARAPSQSPKHRNSFISVHTDDESNDDDEFHNKRHPEEYYNKSPNGTNTLHNSIFQNSNCEDPNISLPQEHHKIEKNKVTSIVTSMSVIAIASIVIACYYSEHLNPVQGTKHADNNYDQLKFYKDMNNLGMKYKIKEDSILRVQSGISTIFQNEDAGSFIFIYNTKSNNFVQEQFNNFMDDITLAAAKYLRNNSASVGRFAINTSNLKMRTHNELMQKYRDDVARTGVMLVKEIDNVPSKLAMAFHYYCDEYNPLVKKSAIFFTLDITKCPNSPVKQLSVHAQIEKCLSMKWNEVPEDKIGPLLSRVVSTVVDVSAT